MSSHRAPSLLSSFAGSLATTDLTDPATTSMSHAESAPLSTPLPRSPDEVLNVNVGVLGHVDSGKTSLVKALSTLLSTAALDKSKQSRQRGMTLDLGFSCFFVDMPAHLQPHFPKKRQIQITLVDCPGHASLIRTIIGGAQIIDMVLLVVDAVKGWQAQTTECLVLAELTSTHLIVALNKADLFPTATRELELQRVQRVVYQRLHSTRFAYAPMIGVAACVGGEKVAAMSGVNLTNISSNNNNSSALLGPLQDASSTASHHNVGNVGGLVKNETYNVDALIQLLKDKLPVPQRNSSGSFYFSIDHCFPIRGRGTVLTGTVLSGKASVNDTIEFPALSLDRKIKSIQMFKRQVDQIQQGDRAGICVSNLDAQLLERGIAASPGAVLLWKGAIALIRKIPYFPGKLISGARFHISVGHATIMATVTFWGARELAAAGIITSSAQTMAIDGGSLAHANRNATNASRNNKATLSDTTTGKVTTKQKQQQQLQQQPLSSSSLAGDADVAGLPRIPFDFQQDFLFQDEWLDALDPAKIIKAGTAPSSSSSPSESSLLHWALLDFQTPVYCPMHSLVIGSRLDTVENAASSLSSSAGFGGVAPSALSGTAVSSSSSCRLAFSGRLIERIEPDRDGVLLRIYTPKERRGIIAKLGDPHRRSDDGKVVRYEVFGADLFKKETNMKPFLGMKVETESGDVGEIKSSYGTAGQFRVYFPTGTERREGDALILRFKRYAHDPKKAMHQDLVLPSARSGSRIEVEKKKSKKKEEKGVHRTGQVSAVKGDLLPNGKYAFAIVAGFFAPEINIKERAGTVVVIPSTGEKGTIVGSFGKAGKCKVVFDEGISSDAVGAKAEQRS